jgi:membrane protein
MSPAAKPRAERPVPSRAARFADLLSWFAASVLVTGGVIYVLTEQDKSRRTRRAPRVVPNATPAQEPLIFQDKRAAEPGRGRQARSPLQIPWTGWRDILLRTYAKIFEDRLMALASSVVFYSLVALFPAIAAGVSFYALFSNPVTIARHLSIVSDIVPAGVLDMVRAEIGRIAARSDGRLTFGFLVSLSIALWSANAGIKSLIDALNVIYDETEKRGFIQLNAESLLFTVCAIAGALVAVAAVVVFPLVLASLGLTSFDKPLIAFVRWPVMFVMMIVALAVLYRYGPSRRAAKWRWLSVGSVFAALAWLAMSSVFSWYLAHFANYDATYGALGAAVGLMMWMWLSAIVVLVGAELNAEIEHQTAHDTTVGGDRPLGFRGAVMADTVGAGRA